MRTRLWFVVFCLSFSFGVQARVSASLDREAGAVGAPFLLRLQITQSEVHAPDLSPLEKDFKILGRRRQLRSTYVQGERQPVQSWLITLAPRYSGDLRVPSLSVGQERTPALNYQALSQAPQENVHLEADLGLALPYARSGVELSLRLYYRQRLSEASLTEPAIEGARVYALGDQRYFEEERQGRRYRVIEQRYSIFPGRPGHFQMPALEFEGVTKDGKNLSARSSPLTFEALAWPPKAEQALVATTNLTLERLWDQPPEGLQSGDRRRLVLVLSAHNLPADSLPELHIDWPEGISATPGTPAIEESVARGILVSEVRIPFDLLFTRPGNLRLPELSLPWFDTAREQLDQARLPAIDLRVAPLLSTEASPTPPDTAAVPSTAEAASAQPRAADDVSTASTEEQPAPQAPWIAWVWAAVALVCAGGWTLTRLQVLRLQERQTQMQAELDTSRQGQGQAAVREQEARAFARLEQSFLQGDIHDCHQALLGWARCFWHRSPPSGLEEIRAAAAQPTLDYLLKNLEYRLRQGEDAEEPWPGDLALTQLRRLRRQAGTASTGGPQKSRVE